MSELTLSYEKPTIQLTGNDGNAFAILGNVRRGMKRAGATDEELKAFMSEATSGDYDHLLQTCMKYVDVR